MNDLLSWLPILNVLLLPGLVFVVRLRDDVRDAISAIKAHAQIDELKFDEHRRDLDRVEKTADAAHSRLDQLGAHAASKA